MKRYAFFVFLCVFLSITVKAHAGVLNPPTGPIAPTPGPEPRTPISTLPGSATGKHRISMPGSYYFCQAIEAPVGMPSMNGIEVDADNVTIDMMGFPLVGLAGGTGKGIVDVSVTPTNPQGHIHTTVKNGIVHSWGTGLRLGGWAVLEEVLVHNSAGMGIEAANGVWAQKVLSRLNGGGGIVAGDYANIQYSWFLNNQGDGVRAGEYSYLNQVGSSENTGNGAVIEEESVTWGGAYNHNGGDGLQAGPRSAVLSVWVFGNTGDGVEASSETTLYWIKAAGNSSVTGGGAGILCTGGGNRIQENTMTSNGVGLRVVTTGNLVIGNSASGNPGGNYQIMSGNAAGPMVGPANILTNTNPHANYDY